MGRGPRLRRVAELMGLLKAGLAEALHQGVIARKRIKRQRETVWLIQFERFAKAMRFNLRSEACLVANDHRQTAHRRF